MSLEFGERSEHAQCAEVVPVWFRLDRNRGAVLNTPNVLQVPEFDVRTVSSVLTRYV